MPDPRNVDENLRQAAQDSMRDPAQIRERVRTLTLQALRQRQFEAKGFSEVMSHMTEGITAGVSAHGHDARAALHAAFIGLDEAFTRAAHASSLAIKELAAKGKEFSASELRHGLDQLRHLEAEFVRTWGHVAETTSDAVKAEMRNLLTHAERAGTGTGKVVASTLQEFSNTLGSQWMQAQADGADAMRVLGERFSLAASGFLAAMSDALKSDGGKRTR